MEKYWGITLLAVPYWNSGMVLNGQGLGYHRLSGASYLDLDTMLNEHGSGHHILSDALQCLLYVVKNE
jgi:hypothetical protein